MLLREREGTYARKQKAGGCYLGQIAAILVEENEEICGPENSIHLQGSEMPWASASFPS